jgi:phosphoribosylformimino-5-aminoimidazole carboxamide ribotide isomerase
MGVNYFMRVIGVLDLLGGRAVHARGGMRDRYEPIQSIAGAMIRPGDALAVAREYVQQFGLTELYIADLDAIDRAAWQDALVRDLAALDLCVSLDAGVSSVDLASRAVGLGVARVVVGLETLPSYETLRQICAALDGNPVVFSLDLRNGEPVVAANGDVAAEPAETVAARAAEAGATAVVVIDLARVGSRRGLDLPLLRRVRAAVPHLTVIAGGGVRGVEDLEHLSDAGCDGALVATALHEGRLRAAEIGAIRSRRRA